MRCTHHLSRSTRHPYSPRMRGAHILRPDAWATVTLVDVGKAGEVTHSSWCVLRDALCGRGDPLFLQSRSPWHYEPGKFAAKVAAADGVMSVEGNLEVCRSGGALGRRAVQHKDAIADGFRNDRARSASYTRSTQHPVNGAGKGSSRHHQIGGAETMQDPEGGHGTPDGADFSALAR